MADRPAQICQLEKGKLIDTQQGFVDTFNWVAQSMANLEGGENCEVDWTLPDHPTIDVSMSESDGDSGGEGGVTAAVYDVVADTQDDKDGITIEYTDSRENSFIPFPAISGDLSGTFVSDISGNYQSRALSVDYSDGTNKIIWLPNAVSVVNGNQYSRNLSVGYIDGNTTTIQLPYAISSLTRENGYVSYNEVLSAKYTNGWSSTAYLGITLSGTDGYAGNQATRFQFESQSDSNVVVNANGNKIRIGVYYV